MAQLKTAEEYRRRAAVMRTRIETSSNAEVHVLLAQMAKDFDLLADAVEAMRCGKRTMKFDDRPN